MKTILGAAALSLLAWIVPAQAATFVTLGGVQWDTTNSGNLSLGAVVPAGNQPQNSPCLICGANQPQQPAGFGYNDFKNAGNLSGISAFSDGGSGRATLGDDVIGVGYQIGSGSLFRNFLEAGGGLGSTTFSVGLDVNDTGTPQTLNSFWFLNLTTHTVLASFTGGTTGNIPSANNGTGYPDYSITGFDLNRNDISIGDTVLFLARMSDMNDGPDSFFLNAAPSPVPLPAALPLFGTAVGGLLLLRRHRRNHSTPA
jgi:hypothetical protein